MSTHLGTFLFDGCLCEPGDVVDDGTEVCGTVQLDLGNTRRVGLANAFCACKRRTKLMQVCSVNLENACAKLLINYFDDKKITSKTLSIAISTNQHKKDLTG